jgi:hypothetical protein
MTLLHLFMCVHVYVAPTLPMESATSLTVVAEQFECAVCWLCSPYFLTVYGSALRV